MAAYILQHTRWKAMQLWTRVKSMRFYACVRCCMCERVEVDDCVVYCACVILVSLCEHFICMCMSSYSLLADVHIFPTYFRSRLHSTDVHTNYNFNNPILDYHDSESTTAYIDAEFTHNNTENIINNNLSINNINGNVNNYGYGVELRKEDARRFADELGEKSGYETKDDWYKLTKYQLFEHPGGMYTHSLLSRTPSRSLTRSHTPTPKCTQTH